jgi:glycosyltransferase involved in cell wall biosynthesis
VEALADYDHHNQYAVIISETDYQQWSDREWPENVSFVPVHYGEPLLAYMKRTARHVVRKLSLQRPMRSDERFLTKQIEKIGLDLLHHPRTVIHWRSTSLPCALTFFDMQHEYYPQFFSGEELAFRARAYRASVEKAVRIVSPSQFTTKTLEEKYEIEESKVTCIPVGLDKRFRRSDSAEINRVKSKYGLPDQFIFYPANPWPHKNHARLIAALRILGQRYGLTPALVLTGRLADERYRAGWLALAAGVEKQVIDLGFITQQDLPALYSAATLMVFPSMFEGFGIPLIEAMACQCPIAAADCTSIPEVTNGAALLFDPCDPGAIADATYQLFHDQELRAKLTGIGLRQIERFQWSRIVPNIISIYQDIAGP